MKIRRLIAALALAAPLAAAAQAPADRWTFSVVPYLWLPSVNGKLNYGPPRAGGSSPNVSIDADTLLDNLDFAFMIMGEARRGRWLIATDVIYLDFGGSDSPVRSVDFNPGPGPINISTTSLNANADTKLTGWLWTLVGGYAAVQDPKWTLDAYQDYSGSRLEIVEVETGLRKVVYESDEPLEAPNWTRDGSRVQVRMGTSIARVRTSDGVIEPVTTLERMPLVYVEGSWAWVGLAPDDSPIALREMTGPTEIYALDVEWP